METLKVSENILKYIKFLDTGRAEIQKRAQRKAETIAEYEKQLAVTILRLYHQKLTEFEEQEIGKLPATLIEKTAKGICWKERLAMEQAEAEYKNAVVGMSALEAQLNGLQSLNRHLAEL
uniref:Uncharacterized protein n=1 Tax=viral metagenome TaxID=1070528 RepID=A0A6H1ZDD3_9ZZZZ